MSRRDDTNPDRDEWLEALLHQSRAEPVPDDGFCERVLEALPPRRPKSRGVLPACALAGTALMLLSLFPTELLQPMGASLPALIILLALVWLSMVWALGEVDD